MSFGKKKIEFLGERFWGAVRYRGSRRRSRRGKWLLGGGGGGWFWEVGGARGGWGLEGEGGAGGVLAGTSSEGWRRRGAFQFIYFFRRDLAGKERTQTEFVSEVWRKLS